MSHGVRACDVGTNGFIMISHRVLDPYRVAFDPQYIKKGGAHEAPPHKYLFHCYMYEYHILQLGILIEGVVSAIPESILTSRN